MRPTQLRVSMALAASAGLSQLAQAAPVLEELKPKPGITPVPPDLDARIKREEQIRKLKRNSVVSEHRQRRKALQKDLGGARQTKKAIKQARRDSKAARIEEQALDKEAIEDSAVHMAQEGTHKRFD